MTILFVCSSNSCRSPFCEYVFKRMVEQDEELNGRVRVDSAGVLNRISSMDARTKKALLREGFKQEDFQGFAPKLVQDVPEVFRDADVIIGMTRWHKFRCPKDCRGKFKTLSEAADGRYRPIPDPWFLPGTDQYYAAMDELKAYLERYLKRLRAELAG